MTTEDPTKIPTVRLDVKKDGNLIETIALENQSVFKFGRDSNNTDPIDTKIRCDDSR